MSIRDAKGRVVRGTPQNCLGKPTPSKGVRESAVEVREREPMLTFMTAGVDYAQYLIDRNDVDDPNAAPVALAALRTIPIATPEDRRSSRFDAIRVLLAVCVMDPSSPVAPVQTPGRPPRVNLLLKTD